MRPAAASVGGGDAVADGGASECCCGVVPAVPVGAAPQASSASTGRAIPQRSRTGSASAPVAAHAATKADAVAIRRSSLGSTSPPRDGGENAANERANRRWGKSGSLSLRKGRPHAVLRRGPERPGERRGEPLATVCGVRQRARVAVAPRLSAEESEQARTVGVIEQQEVDLVGVLVLHDAPGEGAGVEEIRVQPDLAGSG